MLCVALSCWGLCHLSSNTSPEGLQSLFNTVELTGTLDYCLLHGAIRKIGANSNILWRTLGRKFQQGGAVHVPQMKKDIGHASC